MLRSRIIPFLMVHRGGLVKTVQFGAPKYVGDPLNTVRIFNEMEVDELMVVDVDASAQSREPDYKLIGNLAGECRMPLCYGGGVQTPEQVERIVSLGVEKVAFSSKAVSNPAVIGEAALRVGRQSVVVVMDVKSVDKDQGRYELFTHNGRHATGICPVDFARQVEDLGAGEIVLNSIDKDGTLSGYDIMLVDRVREAVRVPISVLGGAGSYDDIAALIRRYGTIGAAAGSLFVFKGRYRAVLVQYPNPDKKRLLALSD
jgi:imidazole glycerol-phosphate synthase subunit HisF